jgi:putative transposase
MVYEKEEQQAPVDHDLIAAVDLEVNVLAAVTSNKSGFVPRLVSGKSLKSLNQYYNKQRAKEQQRLAHEKRFTSRHLDQITTKRNRRIDSYLHTASRRIIDLLIAEGISTLVIGKNPLWKQEVNMGRKNNQQFVHIPHARFIDQPGLVGQAGRDTGHHPGRELHEPSELSGWRLHSNLSGELC